MSASGTTESNARTGRVWTRDRVVRNLLAVPVGAAARHHREDGVMRTYEQLLALHRSLRDTRVLSVYLDGSATDTAEQRSWRLQLDNSLDDLRTWLEGSGRDEREHLEQSIRLLNDTITSLDPNVGAPGWAAFITPERVHLAESLPVPTPTLSVWSTGLCIAPYLRAFKESRPVVVVLADSTKAALYSYQRGEIQRMEVVRANAAVEEPSHMGGPARVGYHTGTRGRTGRDAAQRTLLQGRDRMIADAADHVRDLVRDGAWILLGGTERVTARLAESLDSFASDRVLRLEGLDIHASEAEIADAARAGATQLRNTADDRRIDEIVNLAAAQGNGAVGPEASNKALENAIVRELFISNRYMADHAAEAEQVIRAALDQDALVEEVSGPGAERLDQLGGMAVGLRFRPPGV